MKTHDKRIIRALWQTISNPYMLAIIAMFFIGTFVPFPKTISPILNLSVNIMVFLIFLVYGLKLSHSEVLTGLKNIRLQLSVLFATFFIFPIIGIGLQYVFNSQLGVFAAGFLYLSLLPSTVQSSVGFTAMAKGDVAGAVTAATISNLIGMFITPLYVMLFMGGNVGISWGKINTILLQLILPFLLGQLINHKLGYWIKKHRNISVFVDRSTILLVVLSAANEARELRVWKQISGVMLLSIVLLSLFLIMIMIFSTWGLGKILRITEESQIALVMCGSKKSLASGLPMALVLFPAKSAACAVVPIVIFHQIQLAACSMLATFLAQRHKNKS